MQPAAAIASRLLARPGEWPPASPNARTAIEAFDNLLELLADGSAAASAHGKAFAEAGGIRAVIAVLEETAKDISRRAKNLDTSKQNDVQMLMMLGDVQTMGCTLLSNLGAFAEGETAAIGEELKISKATVAVVNSLHLYPDNPEHIEAGLAALVQLLPIDPKLFLMTGAHDVTINSMLAQQAITWPLYLGARALMRLTDFGDVPKEALRNAGAAAALRHALNAPPGDRDCGGEWGVADVPAKLKLVATTALEALGEQEAGPLTRNAA